jgi:hypothetical protein
MVRRVKMMIQLARVRCLIGHSVRTYFKRDSVIIDPKTFARIVEIGLSKDLHLHVEIGDSNANKREICPDQSVRQICWKVKV